jgi:hypothetical protein
LPFKISGKKRDDGSWVIEVKNLSHKHEPSNDTSGHPSLDEMIYYNTYTSIDLNTYQDV